MQIDAELGQGDRNTDNTSLYILNTSIFMWIQNWLYIDNQKYAIGPLDPNATNGDIVLNAQPIN